MNVKLPNGQIVKNVPDGTTKEQLAEKLNNSSIVSSWENNESTFTGEETKVAFYNGPKSELWSTDKADQYQKEIASGTSKEDAWKKTGILEGTAGVGLREDIGLDGLKFKTGKATRLGDDTSFVFNLKNVGTTNLNDTWIGEGYMKKDEESGEYYFTKRNALTTVGETIEHPTLFKHYPWLKDIPIELVNPSKGNWDNYTELINEEQGGMAGGYYPGKDKWEGELGGTAEAGIEVIENKPVRIVLNVEHGTTAESIRDTLVEEIQHLLDDYENDNFISVRSFEKEVNAQSKQNQLANPGLPPFAVNGKTDQEAFADEYYKNGSPKNNLEALHYVRIDLLNRVDNKYTRDYPRRIKEERKKEIARYYNKDGTLKKEYDEQDVLTYIEWFDNNLGLDNNEKYAEILAERELLKKTTKGPEPVDVIEEAYQNFKRAEVGDLEGFIRTNHVPKEGSSAYGPVQMTRDLVEDMVNNKHIKVPDDLKDYVKRFIEQGNNFLKYCKEPNKPGYDKRYEYGEAGVLTSAQDKKDYKRLAKLIIKYHYDLVGGDTDKLINAWRFGRFDKVQDAKRDDERYYNTYTNTTVNRKTGVRSGHN